MILVCSKHVKDGLKLIVVPHVQLVTVGAPVDHCHLCKNRAKYKLFNTIHQRKKSKEAI